VEEAQYVAVLMSIGAGTESFIRWELPLSRGWAYYHTARLLDGERCRWPEAATAKAEWLEEVRRKYQR
jgi:hypothetical protein